MRKGILKIPCTVLRLVYKVEGLCLHSIYILVGKAHKQSVNMQENIREQVLKSEQDDVIQ